MDKHGGVLTLPTDWRDRLDRLLNARSQDEQREIVADLTDDQKQSLNFEYRTQRERARCLAKLKRSKR